MGMEHHLGTTTAYTNGVLSCHCGWLKFPLREFRECLAVRNRRHVALFVLDFENERVRIVRIIAFDAFQHE